MEALVAGAVEATQVTEAEAEADKESEAESEAGPSPERLRGQRLPPGGAPGAQTMRPGEDESERAAA